ncbi:MAG: HEAT repeat domain-containing protein [Deltaproteobacteria bacterium]|nr:HEAT repeat domain-containing protein [Deltaproteobacteria bacterium]
MSDRPQRHPAISPTTPLGAALERLLANPYEGDVLGRVSAVSDPLKGMLTGGQIETSIAALKVLINCEGEAPNEQSRRAYGVGIRRAISADALERLAPLLVDPLYSVDVRQILIRTGADGTATLLRHLIDAPSMMQRRAFFDALCDTTEGSLAAINLLRDDRWYVVRNMAELLGQLGLESAIPQLAKTLEHSDARVRQSVAGALAKIGTQPTVDLLRRALKDDDLETRKVIARSIEGPKSAALAMPLVLATEDQDDLGLIEECYLALGRIGTPDAVQALINALPPGGMFSRNPPGPRISAVKALGRVGSEAALGALKALKKDPDKAVRAELAKALGS